MTESETRRAQHYHLLDGSAKNAAKKARAAVKAKGYNRASYDGNQAASEES
ncbi:MAG: hypothetical protein NTU95_05590 [Methanothrix sp.]|nr:hypothetical protein [Methanothrix sp.]